VVCIPYKARYTSDLICFILEQAPFSTVNCLTQSKAAVECVTNLSTGIRPHNLDNLVSLHQRISSLSVRIKIVNIPGHSELEGNDIADKCANDVAQRGEITAPCNVSISAAIEVERVISRKSWQRFWDNDQTARYTYNIIPSVQTKVSFPQDRDTGISYVRLLHDTMLKEDSHRTVARSPH